MSMLPNFSCPREFLKKPLVKPVEKLPPDFFQHQSVAEINQIFAEQRTMAKEGVPEGSLYFVDISDDDDDYVE